jgi:hypothetical protein
VRSQINEFHCANSIQAPRHQVNTFRYFFQKSDDCG